MLTAQSVSKRIQPVGPAARDSFERLEKVALIAGVQDYDPDSNLSKLKYSGSADINGMTDALTFQGWHVVTLRNAEAKAGVLVDKLEQLSGLVKQEGGTILFYLSGNGGTGRDNQNYLAAYGANAKRLEREGWRLRRLKMFCGIAGRSVRC